jgi:hypothetical protein
MVETINNSEWLGGGGGDIITTSYCCTLSPGSNIFNAPVNQLPPGVTTGTIDLQIASSSTPCIGVGDMCPEYNSSLTWALQVGTSPVTYTRGCCVAYYFPGGVGPSSGIDTDGGDTGGGDTGPCADYPTILSCEELFNSNGYNNIDYWENPEGTIVNGTYPNNNPLSNISLNPDWDLALNAGCPLTDIESCCTEQNIGFPVQWVNTPYNGFNSGSITLTPEQSSLLQGRCISLNNCTSQIEGFTILEDNSIEYNVGFTNTTLPVPQNCCTDYVVGGLGYSVTWDTVLQTCFAVPDPCPTIATAILDTTNYIVLNATRYDCCIPENIGIDTVYWDYITNQCRYIPQNDGNIVNPCTYDSYEIAPYQTTAQNLTPQNVQQLFGYVDGELLPVSRGCCSSEVTGYNVEWNPDLKICQYTSTNGIDIVLNDEPISIDGCDDVLVSVKMYFTKPSDECITSEDSITVSLLPNNPNITVTQIDVFDSITDGFDEWINLSARFSSVSGGTFNLNLNISGGIVLCCEYDIRVDDIRVDCYKENERLFFDTKKCVGFDLTRVIDNKRSWVYNPGADDIGSTQDNLIRDRGEDGLIQGYGVINRTFAPSADADIPWRYTDYYEQSNILEPHSKAVIISKEMELTFNMCSECCATYSQCPSDYTLVTTTGGTKYCTKTTIYCPSGYTLSAGTCYSGITTASTISETITGETGSYCVQTANLLQLEEYKKVFQSFWVRMIEQFVPATTIFISGEKWCNNDAFICTQFEECDYDFEYVDSEITILEYSTDPELPEGPHNTNGGDVDETFEPSLPMDNTPNSELSGSNNEPIVIDGFNITPADPDPTGGGGILVEREITPRLNRPFEVIKERYYNGIIKGGVKEIFQ